MQTEKRHYFRETYFFLIFIRRRNIDTFQNLEALQTNPGKPAFIRSEWQQVVVIPFLLLFILLSFMSSAISISIAVWDFHFVAIFLAAFFFFHSVCCRDNFSLLMLFYILLCTLCVLLPAMGSVSGYSREGKYECFLFCFYLISEWNGQQVPVLFSFRIVLFFFLVFLRILL